MAGDIAAGLCELDAAIRDLAEAIGAVPEVAVAPVDWGPHEMLAHIVFAHELYVSYLAATAAGNPAMLFGGLYREQNARAVAENRRVSVPELLARLMAAQDRLRLLVNEPGVSDAPFYFKAKSTGRTLSEALVAIAGHMRGHARDIRRIARADRA